jgi:hypothetical protein
LSADPNTEHGSKVNADPTTEHNLCDALDEVRLQAFSPTRQSTNPASIHVPDTFAAKHPSHLERLSKDQLTYSISGLILGGICVVGGIVLFLNGVAGSTSWTAKILSAESNVSDAAPGAVLFIVGLFVVFSTRYVLRVQK